VSRGIGAGKEELNIDGITPAAFWAE